MSDTTTCPDCRQPTQLVAGRFTTCGNLTLSCSRYCPACKKHWLPSNDDLRAFAVQAGTIPPAPWHVATSGLSVDAGDIRIRFEGSAERARKEYLALALAQLPALLEIKPVFDELRAALRELRKHAAWLLDAMDAEEPAEVKAAYSAVNVALGPAQELLARLDQAEPTEEPDHDDD